jgi:uncharacterized membrane protein
MASQGRFSSFSGLGSDRTSKPNLRAFRPYVAIASGAAIAVIGASRRNIAGAILAAAGGYLAYQGFRHSQPPRAIHVESSLTINRPVEDVYRFWRNLENLPKFMQHVRSVSSIGQATSHWEAWVPLGMTIEWDAGITDERENHFLVWRSLSGSLVEHRGSVEFREAPANRGTEIFVALNLWIPAGRVGAAFAKLFGENPEQQIRGDLRRMKQLLETGEIATTDGQSSGRRSPFVRMMQAATPATRQQRAAS